MEKYVYYALRVQIGAEEYAHHVVEVAQDHRLVAHYPFRKETPGTMYVEGKLCLRHLGSPSGQTFQPIVLGVEVEVWQAKPYDLVQNVTTSQTREFKIY